MVKVVVYLFLYLNCATYTIEDDYDDTSDDVKELRKFCREKDRLISGEKDDIFNLVEAKYGESIMLECQYCKEASDAHPKNWFKLDRLDDSKIIEVELGTDNNMSYNRLHVDMEHELYIHNITEEDAGEYFCKRLDSDIEFKNLISFYVDVIKSSEIAPEKGNLTAWKKYHDEQFLPINKLLGITNDPDYTNLKRKLKISLELVTEWDTEGPCEICGRPKGGGRKYKTGHCRFKILSPNKIQTKNYNEKLLLRATHLSCRSMALKNIIPSIITKTENIPDFVLVEPCTGICNPDAEGVYKGWRSTKKKGFKYRKTFVLAEHAHLTLICPESTLENQVVWRINGKVIKPGESVIPSSPKIEPRVTVDTFNSLYLYEVTKDEEGNYTCTVDDVRMQQVRVFVVSKAKLLTQAFLRHMVYLAFVLSLTLSCYCAGLVITWTRRKRFKSYRQLRSELKEQYKLIDSDSDSDESIVIFKKKDINITEDHEKKKKTKEMGFFTSDRNTDNNRIDTSTNSKTKTEENGLTTSDGYVSTEKNKNETSTKSTTKTGEKSLPTNNRNTSSKSATKTDEKDLSTSDRITDKNKIETSSKSATKSGEKNLPTNNRNTDNNKIETSTKPAIKTEEKNLATSKRTGDKKKTVMFSMSVINAFKLANDSTSSKTSESSNDYSAKYTKKNDYKYIKLNTVEEEDSESNSSESSIQDLSSQSSSF